MSALSCMIIGGASLLFMFVPIPLPAILSFLLAVGVAVYLTMHYSGVPLIPYGLFIPLGVEIVFRFAHWVID